MEHSVCKVLTTPRHKSRSRSSVGSFNLKDLKRMCAMQVRSPVSGIVTDYSIYGSFIPEGEDIVLLAKFVAALANSTATLGQPVSSFDLSIVGPLYFVAHECRDPCL